MKKNIIHFTILVLLFFIFIIYNIYSYGNTISNDLKNNFFRLHILANSNSEIDQQLKFKVRDSILKYLEENRSYSDISKVDVIQFINTHLVDIKNIVENTIIEEGYNYPVSLNIGDFYFPTKHYGNISLPSGYYDGLKVEIGKAKGENWWCSLFPPLCFVDISSGIIDEESQKNLKESLNSEEFAIITNDSKPIKLKFKLLELLSK